jgi:hypothetical protein
VLDRVVGDPEIVEKVLRGTHASSDAMLSRYVRDGKLFLGNAAGILL